MGQLPALILAPGNQRRATKEDAREWGVKLKDDMPRRSGSEGEDWSESSSEDEASVESSSEDETWTRRDSEREGGGYRGDKDLAAELVEASKNLKPTRREKHVWRSVDNSVSNLILMRRHSMRQESGSESDAAMEKQLARLIVMLGA
jgi:hypothetical protein